MVNSVLPFDLTEILAAELAEGRRENDGLLHASSHLVGSLRHAQLDVVGAPRVESQIVSDVRLWTGTMWHRFIQETLVKAGIPFMQEVNLTPWMPRGWGGTADLLVWVPNGGKDGRGGFVLRDVKTTKGEAIKFRMNDGPSDEHVWQVSSYYHAAVRMGLPMIRECGIYYLPMNDTREKNDEVVPLELTFEPLAWPVVRQQMEHRNNRASAYKRDHDDFCDDAKLFSPGAMREGRLVYPEAYLLPSLEPEQERVLKPYFSRRDNKWELKLVPHWSAAFCPFPDELCSCSSQGVTKVGEWSRDGQYIPRSGYDVTPPPYPGRN